MEQKEFNKIYDELVNDEFIIMNKPWQDAKEENSLLHLATICIIILFNIILFSFLISITEFNESINKILFCISTLALQQVILVPIYFILLFINKCFSKDREKNNFKEIFKEKIISKLINNFFYNAEYLPTEKISKEVYNEAEFDIGYSTYYSEDYIKAQIDNEYDVEMAEFYIDKPIKGIFAKIDMKKSVDSVVQIHRNSRFIFLR